MEWYCRVDFTSPGQYMLVVAFNFKESESKEEDSVLNEVALSCGFYEPMTVNARGCFHV